MKFILTKYQYEVLLSEEKGDDNIIKFDNDVINAFQKVVNRMMKQKYQWFENIQINYLSYMQPMRYMGIEGVISVDMEWGAKQWRELHDTQYFPGNYYFQTGEVTDSVSFGDIINSDLGNEIREIFIQAIKIVIGIFEIKTLSWSWLMTKFIENPENDDLVTEEISDMKKVKAMDKVLQNEYPNQYTDEHAGSTLVLTDEEDAYILFKYDWGKNTLYYNFDLIYKPFDKWLPFDEFEYGTSFNDLLRDYSEYRFGDRPHFVHSITA